MGPMRGDITSLEPGGGGRLVLLALADRLDEEAARADALRRGDTNAARGRAAQVAAARGTAYAAAHIVRALREDNADAVRASGRAARWGEVLDRLDEAAAIDPMIAGDRHLTQAGYAMLLASNGLRDIAEGVR
jgi:hypothetical protein